MRPVGSVSIDRMACLTYSLDLVAVTAMLISMTGKEDDELSGGPMCLTEALETLGPRLKIIYQKGRLQAARSHFGILHLFDGVLHAVEPRQGSSWHPKAVLTRYVSDSGSIHWRFWLGSRNLTVSTDREAGLVLHGAPGKMGKRIPEIEAMIRELAPQLQWPEHVLAELSAFRWQGPPGVIFRKLHWRMLGKMEPFFKPLPKAKRTLVVSPFVNQGGLSALRPRQDRSAMELVTIATTASVLGDQPGINVRVDLPPQPDAPALISSPDGTTEDESPAPITLHGLHAKLILQRSDSTNRLWIGSANVTGRGLVGGNVEIMAELDVEGPAANALEAFVQMRDIATLGPPSAETLAQEAADRALDDALHRIFEVDFTLTQLDDGLVLETTADFSPFLAHYQLDAWLFTFPETAVNWPTGQRSILLRSGQVPLKLQTFLVGFRATSRHNPLVKRTWAQSVAFPDLDIPARNRAATAAYIGASNLSAWFRARLQGITPTEAKTWTGADKPGSSWGLGDSALGIRDFALEEVLSAWARNPEQFEERARSISEVLDGFRLDLTELKDENGLEALRQLGEVDSFWSSVRECLEIGSANGA